MTTLENVRAVSHQADRSLARMRTARRTLMIVAVCATLTACGSFEIVVVGGTTHVVLHRSYTHLIAVVAPQNPQAVADAVAGRLDTFAPGLANYTRRNPADLRDSAIMADQCCPVNCEDGEVFPNPNWSERTFGCVYDQ